MIIHWIMVDNDGKLRRVKVGGAGGGDGPQGADPTGRPSVTTGRPVVDPRQDTWKVVLLRETRPLAVTVVVYS